MTTRKKSSIIFFSSQIWRIQLRNLLMEHLNVQVIDDICNDIGKKVVVEPENCRPCGTKLITIWVEVDLKKPLKIGGWLYTARSNKIHWARYHFEKQPRKIWKECFVVDHVDSACEKIANQLKVAAYTPEEFYVVVRHSWLP